MSGGPAERSPALLRRPGADPATAPGKPSSPGTAHEIVERDGLLIERNIAVPLRDGVAMRIDVYRGPARADARLPVLLAWSPYGKHALSDRLWPAAGVQPGWISPYTGFEAPDPAYWCAQGYAVVYTDPRGLWWTPGEMHHGGVAEARDTYDLIEWLGVQPWSNGRVGMTGVSYLACAQYQVAALRPPHLAAINPWEGFSDWYREFGYHGGIRDTGFVPKATLALRYGGGTTEDTVANMIAHPLHDAYWQSKEVDLAAIACPAFFVASWSDQGLHTRGTLEAYKACTSARKYLLVHGQKKWANYYAPENVELQRRWFDNELKDTKPVDWPAVRIEVRERAGVGRWRNEAEWPLARTRYVPLYLDPAARALTATAPKGSSSIAYDALVGRASFDHRFLAETELTGHMKLRLWIEIDEGDDADLFVAIQKLDADGREVPFTFYAVSDEGPVALGWLRASHRALDPARSTPWQPFHPHDREEPLVPARPVAVEIEIWPSSTLFRAGEQLRVVVQGRDLYPDLPQPPAAMRHEDTRNRGRHILHGGGRWDAHLLVPTIADG